MAASARSSEARCARRCPARWRWHLDSFLASTSLSRLRLYKSLATGSIADRPDIIASCETAYTCPFQGVCDSLPASAKLPHIMNNDVFVNHAHVFPEHVNADGTIDRLRRLM